MRHREPEKNTKVLVALEDTTSPKGKFLLMLISQRDVRLVVGK